MITRFLFALLLLLGLGGAAHASNPLVAPRNIQAGYANLPPTTTTIPGMPWWNTTCPDPIKPGNLQRGQYRPDAWRFIIHEGDTPPGDEGRTPPRDRCEFDGAAQKDAYNVTYWQAYSIRSTWATTLTSGQMIIGQWHKTAGVGIDPILSWRLEINGNMRIVTNNDLNTSTTWYTTNVGSLNGVWVDIVMSTRMNAAGSATLAVWIRFGSSTGAFTQVVNATNASIGHVDDTFPYWKFGVYRYSAPEVLTSEYANQVFPTVTNLTPLLTCGAECWRHPSPE